MQSEKTENFLKLFMSAWQIARIYESGHPKAQEAFTMVYESLSGVLSGRPDIVIGIFGDELASGEDIFFDLSKKVMAAIDHLKKMGIEKITFTSGIRKEEIIGFIDFLMVPIDEVDRPAQEYLTLRGITHINVDKLRAAGRLPRAKAKDTDIKLSHYQACLESSASVINSFVENGAIDLLRLQFVSRDVIKYFAGDHRIFLELAQIKGHDMATFSHLMNVSALAVYFAYKLGFARKECLDISVAALFHDIGKLYIAKKILQKPEPLDSREFTAIKSHTTLGAELLAPHKDIISELPAVVAFEHHRNFDGSGYPSLPFSHENHVASSIISICDVYDALISRRTYKRDYPCEAIYKIMTRERGKRYHPELLDIFFKIIGVWPKGAIVKLTDSSVAIVRKVNEKDIFSPQVEVVSRQPGELIDTSKSDALKIARSMNSLSEAKEYVKFL
jgi:putative nucleotidyltransferase with HDIG domain